MRAGGVRNSSRLSRSIAATIVRCNCGRTFIADKSLEALPPSKVARGLREESDDAETARAHQVAACLSAYTNHWLQQVTVTLCVLRPRSVTTFG